MKILQMLPALEAGGVECTVRELASAVVKAGHESLVVSGGGSMVSDLEAEGSRHISMAVGRKGFSSFLLVKTIRRLFETEAPDIVHLHSRVPAWIAWLAWRKMPAGMRPRLVTTVHGFYSVNFYSAVMTRGERVLAVSESAKEYVLKNYPGVEADRIKAISLGVDTSEYYPGYAPSPEWLENWKTEYPHLEGKWVLCLPGRLTRLKGHEDFFKVISGLKQRGIPVHGLIVGGAHKRKQEYAGSLKQMVLSAGLEQDITFTGHRTDLRELLSVSDVVLSLTIVPESFGRTTLESLALGKPTLGYSHGGVEEQLNVFLPDGKIPVRDVEAAIERLAEWYASPPRLPGEILPPYRLQDMTAANLAVYGELITSPRD